MDAGPTLKTPLEIRGRTPPQDLGSCVTVLVNAVARGMAQIVAAHGLTHIDFALLRLFLGEKEWTATQLAEMLPLAPSGISRSVTKLADRGLIRRRRRRSDRRVVTLTLTKEGTTLTQDLHERVQAYDSKLCDGVSAEEMAAFVSVTSKVAANYVSAWPAVNPVGTQVN